MEQWSKGKLKNAQAGGTPGVQRLPGTCEVWAGAPEQARNVLADPSCRSWGRAEGNQLSSNLTELINLHVCGQDSLW